MRFESSIVTRSGVVVLALIGLVVAWHGVSAALEGDFTRIDGRVQWISGQKMVVAPVNGGVSIPVDLGRVPVQQYVGVMPGSWVSVTGLPSLDVRRVIAMSVTPVEGPEEQITLLPRTAP